MEINREVLRALRERSGFSQSELARRSGLTQGYISALESGAKDKHGNRKKGSPASIKTLAEVLDVPVMALVLTTTEATA